MVRLLLDTHTFVWRANGDAKLSSAVGELLNDPANEKLVSAASVWEIAIKNVLGRQTDLVLPDTPTNIAIKIGFVELPVKFEHAEQAALLPLIHADPFDRMLIAQAKVENLTLVTVDPEILRYDVAAIYAS